jgi:hypothetical protein
MDILSPLFALIQRRQARKPILLSLLVYREEQALLGMDMSCWHTVSASEAGRSSQMVFMLWVR